MKKILVIGVGFVVMLFSACSNEKEGVIDYSESQEIESYSENNDDMTTKYQSGLLDILNKLQESSGKTTEKIQESSDETTMKIDESSVETTTKIIESKEENTQEKTTKKNNGEEIGGSVIIENETEKEDGFTKEIVLSEVQRLWGDMKKYVGQDYYLYSKLFVNSKDDKIKKFFSRNLHLDEVDKSNFTLLGFDYPYAHIQIDDYVVTGQHPNTKRRSYSYVLSMEYTDNGWAFVYNDNSDKSLNAIVNNKELYNEGYVDAALNGRNAVMFGNTYMFVDSTAVYKGCLDNQVLFAWQQEDGSVCLGIWLVNGTNQNIAYKSAEITISSEIYGEVLSVKGTVDWTIRANTSSMQYIVIDASQIKTGTQKWGALSSSISTIFN